MPAWFPAEFRSVGVNYMGHRSPPPGYHVYGMSLEGLESTVVEAVAIVLVVRPYCRSPCT